MIQFTVIFYEDITGDKPVENFLLSLDIKMRAKLIGILQILQEKGNQLREPYSKHLKYVGKSDQILPECYIFST